MKPLIAGSVGVAAIYASMFWCTHMIHQPMHFGLYPAVCLSALFLCGAGAASALLRLRNQTEIFPVLTLVISCFSALPVWSLFILLSLGMKTPGFHGVFRMITFVLFLVFIGHWIVMNRSEKHDEAPGFVGI